jgi:hypothetical protein
VSVEIQSSTLARLTASSDTFKIGLIRYATFPSAVRLLNFTSCSFFISTQKQYTPIPKRQYLTSRGNSPFTTHIFYHFSYSYNKRKKRSLKGGGIKRTTAVYPPPQIVQNCLKLEVLRHLFIGTIFSKQVIHLQYFMVDRIVYGNIEKLKL